VDIVGRLDKEQPGSLGWLVQEYAGVVEDLRVIRHAGFFRLWVRERHVVVGGLVGFESLLKVTVLEFNGGSVRLGFEIDSSVPVHRWEVWEKIRAGAKPASTAEGPAAPVA
jgi:sRNA-binding carbon storage regulator CsrA